MSMSRRSPHLHWHSLKDTSTPRLITSSTSKFSDSVWMYRIPPPSLKYTCLYPLDFMCLHPRGTCGFFDLVIRGSGSVALAAESDLVCKRPVYQPIVHGPCFDRGTMLQFTIFAIALVSHTFVARIAQSTDSTHRCQHHISFRAFQSPYFIAVHSNFHQ